MQWPIEELETLRGKNVKMSHQQLQTGNHIEIKGITAAQVLFKNCLFQTLPLYVFYLYSLIMCLILLAG